MKIAVLGGTFDPPHFGHLILANEALSQLKIDQVLWVLTPFPPHKKRRKITALSHRQRMLELAIQGNPRFILSKVDIDRQPPHYAVDTMKLLRQQSPEDEYYYLMGMDSLNDLPTWHTPVEFVSHCHHIVVMLRHHEEGNEPVSDADITGLRSKLMFLKTPIIQISGTDIRSRVKRGKPYRYFVPENVYQYIQENHLYQE